MQLPIVAPLTVAQLALACGCTLMRAGNWVAVINDALSRYPIDTPSRRAMWLAQIAHESGRLLYTREIWGPQQVPAQARYEGRADLGNTQPGDGFKFRGAGLIQVTGRANFAAARDGLSVAMPAVPDFERFPELLAVPRWAAASAAWYWDSRGLNAYADAGDFDGVSDVINRGRKTPAIGDANGYPDRLALLASARSVLGVA